MKLQLIKQIVKQKLKKQKRQESPDSESEVELVLESDTCTDEVIEGDFVVVKVEGKSREVRYIAQVDTIDGDEFEGTFLKKVPQIVGHVPVLLIIKN